MSNLEPAATHVILPSSTKKINTDRSYKYIGSPYTHKSKTVMRDRYYMVSDYTAYCIKQGQFVYSPIVHCHPLAIDHNLPRDVSFWIEYNACMLLKSNCLLVLCLSGWKSSVGLLGEIDLAYEYGVKTAYIDPITYGASGSAPNSN